MHSDVPAFENFLDCSRLIAGSSILGAEILRSGENDIVLNWLGGFHHARKSCAYGFCYVNDCVLSIIHLLADFEKVLYIDIDVHHGDGVEEAFAQCSRVMTLSFHQFEEDSDVPFFPGTGGMEKSDSIFRTCNMINVPIKSGCDNFHFEYVFNKITDNVIDKFRPDAIVIQCGADSLVGDALGGFNLSIEGHANAFRRVLSYNKPTLCLGGGGYTLENVSRCWTYESSIALNIDLQDKLPEDLKYQSIYTQKHLTSALYNKHGIITDKNKIQDLDALIAVSDQKLRNLFQKNFEPMKVHRPENNIKSSHKHSSLLVGCRNTKDIVW